MSAYRDCTETSTAGRIYNTHYSYDDGIARIIESDYVFATHTPRLLFIIIRIRRDTILYNYRVIGVYAEYNKRYKLII